MYSYRDSIKEGLMGKLTVLRLRVAAQHHPSTGIKSA